MKNATNFNQKNYLLTPIEPRTTVHRIESAEENFPVGNPDNNLLSSHGILFFPSINLLKFTNINNKFYIVITFNSFRGVKVKKISGETNDGFFRIKVELDYSTIDYSTFCLSELIVDINQFNELQISLENEIRCNYIVTIENPLTKESIENKNITNFGDAEVVAGSTDPINGFPFLP